MHTSDKVYVAGHRGMVGAAICRALKEAGFNNIVVASRSKVDLTNREAVDAFFAREKPDFVFLAAAKVGGIIANSRYGGDFIYENLVIQTNVIDAAFRAGVRKLCFLGSSCIYPREAPQPMTEDMLLTGPLEETNLPYAVAKIAGKVMCDSYRKQHGFDAFTVMPSNVYGISDNFHPENSHVVAALMRRFHDAKLAGQNEVVVWGTGAPMREFIFSEDIGRACVYLMQHHQNGGMVNAGTGEEVSIRQLAKLVAKTVGHQGPIKWDVSKPDGTPRKVMDNSKLRDLGWTPGTMLTEGLARMYGWYLQQLENGPSSIREH